MMSFSRYEHSVSGPRESHLPQNTLFSVHETTPVYPALTGQSSWQWCIHLFLPNEFTALLFLDLDINLTKEGNILAAGMSLGNCFTEVSLGNYSVVMQSANSLPENLEGEAVGWKIMTSN